MIRLILTILAFCPSCALIPRPAPAPLAVLEAGKSGGNELVVFLPGRWSQASEFEREGFFRMAAERWPQSRLVAPDLHIGYYRNQTLAKRLHQDIILPARESGVETFRFVGISMGGIGALIYDVEYPGQIDELILLSPYLGEQRALREIEISGGASHWQPGPIAESDYTRRLWLRLREKWLRRAERPRVLLGCGLDDRLAASNRLFSSGFLNPEETLWQAGAHDWATWRTLFGDLSAR